MDDKTREAIGLLRHQIISPVLVESSRAQMSYFKKMALKEFDVPGQGKRCFKPTTMKGWLHRYRKNGFAALLPKVRADYGRLRKLSPEQISQVLELRSQWEELNVSQFYLVCRRKELLGQPPVCEATLRHFLKKQGLHKGSTPKARRRFEMSRFGELWLGDFMHGPHVLPMASSQKARKAILLAIIDDHSRVIVGAEFALTENTLALEKVFKEAVLKYGLPDRLYVDNGPSFSSGYLAKACAQLQVGLVHSKPYDSPSRGKIERFFRSLRSSFLATLPKKQITLTELNDLLLIWIRDQYHQRKHNGIATRPIDRYRQSISQFPLKRVAEEHLEELFFASETRRVKKDATLVVRNIVYEVPTALIGQRVELRHSQERPNEIFLYDQEQKVQKLRPVDVRANGKTYRPQSKDTVIPYQEVYHD